MINFEGYSRRIDKINSVLGEYGIESLEAAQQIVSDNGIDVRSIVLGIQPIAFENAVWAYTVGAAIAIKAGAKMQPKPQSTSERVFRRSVSPVRLRTSAKSASATAISEQCC